MESFTIGRLSSLALTAFAFLGHLIAAAPTVADSDEASWPEHRNLVDSAAEDTVFVHAPNHAGVGDKRANAAPTHLARQEDDSWIHCSDDPKFKASADDVKACRTLLSAVIITDHPACIHEVKDRPLKARDGSHTASYVNYIAMNSALIIPWEDLNPDVSGFNEFHGNCHEVADVLRKILDNCIDPDGMVGGWTTTLGPASSKAGVKIVKQAGF